jgi:M6 family metalloprotease-like protein
MEMRLNSFLLLLLLVPFNIAFSTPISKATSPHHSSMPYFSLTPPLDVSYSGLPEPISPSEIEAEKTPVLGTLTIAIIAVYFKDVQPKRTIEDLNSQMERMNEYYKEVSYGKVSLSWSIFGWVKLSRSLESYGRDVGGIDDTNGDTGIDSYLLVFDAIALVDKDVDFSQYSYLMVLHAGYGQESSGNSSDIWSVAYIRGIAAKTAERTYSQFAIIPELEARGAVSLGVWCHEFGHLLGLPDLYGRDEKTNPNVGLWDLMARGSWGGDPPGSSPSHLCAWSKIKLGWIDENAIQIVEQGSKAESLLGSENASTMAIKIPTSKTYYLLEFRDGKGFDAFLPSGILILFVDERRDPAFVKVIPQHGDRTLSTATLSPGELFFDKDNIVQVAPVSRKGDSIDLIVDRESLKPDIMVRIISPVNERVEAGTTISLQVEVKNQGAVDATFQLNVYSDASLLQSKTLSLSINQSQTLSFSISVPMGIHKIRALAEGVKDINDYNNQIDFSLESGYSLSIQTERGAWVRINGTEYVARDGTVTAFITSPNPFEVEAQPIVSISEGFRKRFLCWNMGVKSPALEVKMNSSMTLSANYIMQYYAEVINAEGSGWYDEKSNILLRVDNPKIIEANKTREVFLGWSGSINSNNTSLIIAIDKPLKVIANWKRQHFLFIRSAFPIEGTGWYDEGSVVKISVRDFSNATMKVQFIGWSGHINGKDREISVKMDDAMLLKALWHISYLIHVQFIDESGRILKTCPSSLLLRSQNGTVVTVNMPTQFWLDEGEWIVEKVVFKGVDAKSGKIILTPSANATLKVPLHVFSLIVEVHSSLTDFPLNGQVVANLTESNYVENSSLKDGVTVFSELPAGNYTIEVSAEGGGTKSSIALNKNNVVLIRVAPLKELILFSAIPLLLITLCVVYTLALRGSISKAMILTLKEKIRSILSRLKPRPTGEFL